MIDVYQAATQMTDESDQTFPFTIDTLLDRRSGPRATTARSSPTCTPTPAPAPGRTRSSRRRRRAVGAGHLGEQLLTWVDGRNGSSFGNIGVTGTTLTFSIAVGSGANGLEAMFRARRARVADRR